MWGTCLCFSSFIYILLKYKNEINTDIRDITFYWDWRVENIMKTRWDSNTQSWNYRKVLNIMFRECKFEQISFFVFVQRTLVKYYCLRKPYLMWLFSVENFIQLNLNSSNTDGSWLIELVFWVPTKFFRYSSRKLILKEILSFYPEIICCLFIRIALSRRF